MGASRGYVLVLLGAAGCAASPAGGITTVGEDPSDFPLRAASAAERDRFREGDAVFDGVHLEADGLGPVYVRGSCAACHEAAARGPGGVEKMVLVEADGFTPSADQTALPWGHTARPYHAGGAATPLLPPAGTTGLKVTQRLGPPVFGRGYLEAVVDTEIERVQAEQARRSDGIRGHINRVSFTSADNPDRRYHQHTQGERGLIGRFGLKARIATLDDFAADAAQGDMSITSPMRPDELPNPDGRTDDFKPGVDVDIEAINQLADYLRLLEMPSRSDAGAPARALFEGTLCAVCHVPSLRTRADYPIAALAGIDAPVFTDLLVHDMGARLADGIVEAEAGSRRWRTAPLIGLRHLRGYLHDGRARTLDQAILLHGDEGSEAAASVERYRALSQADRDALLDYVRSL